MTDTVNLGLPCIEAAQAQKHVTHNEALRLLDTLVQLAVLDRDLTAPPGSPSDGQRWVVKDASPSGAWAGHGNQIAAWQDGAWQFSVPRTGWLAYVADEGALLAWTGSAWVDAITAITSLNDMVLLGVGTTADATNPFSAKLNNILWVAKTIAEGGDGDLRWKMSKESASDTLSMLFQDNYSGRAELGLTGDDDFHFKVSADGTTWRDAIVIDKSTGAVAFPQGGGSSAYGAADGVQVNGGVDVSQELGTTGATLTNNTAKYTADCWEAMYNHGAATAVVTSAQVAAGSFGAAMPGFGHAHQIKATTAISSPASGDFAKHRQKIEGYRVAAWGWGASGALDIVVACQFYSVASGIAFVRLGNSAGNRFYYHEVTVAAGVNFAAFAVPGDTSGTWVTNSGIGLTFELFVSGKETTRQSTLDAWGATNKVQTTNSGNLLGTNNNYTQLTGVYIAAGTQLPVASDMPRLMRSFDEEQMLCQRYYRKTYEYATAPATATRVGMVSLGIPGNGSDKSASGIPFSLPMRAAPTMSTWDGAGTANGSSRYLNGSFSDGVSLGGSMVNSSESGFLWYANSANTLNILIHYVADARL